MTSIPESPADFSLNWLEHALGAQSGSLAGFDYEPIGTGQIADSYRLRLDWARRPDDAPDSLAIKCPSPDETSLASAKLMNLYVKEVNWYRELAPQSFVCVPHCYHAELSSEGDRFALLLEDCAPARQGDQLGGASLAEIEVSLDEAARLHAPFLEDPMLQSLDWLRIDPEMAAMRKGFIGQFWPAFRERYADRLSPELFEMGDAYIAKIMAKDEDEQSSVTTVVHGDFRIDNMLFGRPDGRVVVLDWQTLYPGHPLSDVAYLVGTSIADPALRKSEEAKLVEYYCDRMAELGAPLDRDDAWSAYRQFASTGFIMAITASMLAKRTERGDEMFAVMAERPARQMMDLDTLSVA
jgi:hypothetical protein